jgi:hypothetical protein
MPKGTREKYEIGQKFNQLTLLEILPIEAKRRFCIVQCDCGSEPKKLNLSKVVRGLTKSCGCQRGKYSGSMSIAYHVFSECYTDGDVSFEEFYWLTQQECWICGKWNPSIRKHRTNKSITFSYHGLDRLDSNQVHNRLNVKTCCWKCNERKSNANVSEFLQWIHDSYHNLFSENIMPRLAPACERG